MTGYKAKIFDWTDEAISFLRVMWGEGHSAAKIGRRMGISKNAVVGKAHRLNLPARPSPIKVLSPRRKTRPSIQRGSPSSKNPARAQP